VSCADRDLLIAASVVRSNMVTVLIAAVGRDAVNGRKTGGWSRNGWVRMFLRTHHDHAPWTVVRANDRKCGRLEAMKFILNCLDYPDRDPIVTQPDRLIVGPPDVVAADAGETPTHEPG
jgi:hypothetical protein